jgi:hypothetical protein
MQDTHDYRISLARKSAENGTINEPVLTMSTIWILRMAFQENPAMYYLLFMAAVAVPYSSINIDKRLLSMKKRAGLWYRILRVNI